MRDRDRIGIGGLVCRNGIHRNGGSPRPKRRRLCRSGVDRNCGWVHTIQREGISQIKLLGLGGSFNHRIGREGAAEQGVNESGHKTVPLKCIERVVLLVQTTGGGGRKRWNVSENPRTRPRLGQSDELLITGGRVRHRDGDGFNNRKVGVEIHIGDGDIHVAILRVACRCGAHRVREGYRGGGATTGRHDG